MNTDPKYDELEKVFNVGVGLDNLKEPSLEGLRNLLAEVDFLFDRFIQKYTIDDLQLIGLTKPSIMILINDILIEEGYTESLDDIHTIFSMFFTYALVAAYTVWSTEGLLTELRDMKALVTYIYETDQSKEVIETHLIKALRDLGITENIYLYIFYLCGYVYQNLTRVYPRSN